jgi:predicted O-methyltransferase YrrM
MHLSRIKEEGLPIEHLTYMGNDVGTYLYNLIRLKRYGKKYDLIYLDGHHTLYVDFAAAMACLPLLKPGGYFALDDVTWTLAKKEESLKTNEFYSMLYDFSQYTEEEKQEPHIGLIIQEYLEPFFGLQRADEFSLPYWIVLRAPSNWTDS